MSLQSTFNPNSTMLINNSQLFHQKSMNTLLNQSSIQKKQKSFKTQAGSFLKKSICNMIKDELKAYRLQQKLNKQLQVFKKTKQKKMFNADLHHIQKFRHQQSQNLKSKYENYIKQKQKRDSIAESIIQRKKHQNQHKFQSNKRKIQSVRKRYLENQNNDIQNRLSRAESIQSINPLKSHLKSNSSERNVSSSHNFRRIIDQKLKQEQRIKITNFLKKMKHVQNRILEQQLKKQQRKNKSIKSQVKNLTASRNMKEEQKMKNLQQKFQTKMGTFYDNLNRSQLQNSQILMNRSMMKSRLRQKVIRNKQMNQSHIINQTIDSFVKKNHQKQNIHSHYQRKMDLLRSKSNFMSNAIKLHKQQLQKQNQKNIRILYQRLNKIQRIKPNQTISQKQKEDLLSLLDSQDPFYQQIHQFLSNTKAQFFKKKIEKEQQLAKAQKIKKTARFNNKN